MPARPEIAPRDLSRSSREFVEDNFERQNGRGRVTAGEYHMSGSLLRRLWRVEIGAAPTPLRRKFTARVAALRSRRLFHGGNDQHVLVPRQEALFGKLSGIDVTDLDGQRSC